MPAPKISRSNLANRGKEAEKQLHDFLKSWAFNKPYRDFERLVDTKAAGRVIKAAKADFEWLSQGMYGLLECKQTKHPHRLERAKVTQLPRLRKQSHCGAVCGVLIYHSEIKTWRYASMNWLDLPNDVGSWDLRGLPAHSTVAEALHRGVVEMFLGS